MRIDRNSQLFPGIHYPDIKAKMLNWLKQFNIFCLLENHSYSHPPFLTETLVAAGCRRFYSSEAGKALAGLQSFLNEKGQWYFGHLGYDLKNEIEFIQSNQIDRIGFPDVHFFSPEIVIEFKDHCMIIHAENPSKVLEEIFQQQIFDISLQDSIDMISGFTRAEYIDNVQRIKKHILRGDCYELNFCVEFHSYNKADSFSIYQNLTTVSPNPFSAFYRMDDKFVCCASPERFICKKGEKLISQPIKGTTKRENDTSADLIAKENLFMSSKERAENVMVVDLVRNDLSKVCEGGSVKVEELFGIYTFPQVHQMISTVSGIIAREVDFTEIIHALFPMGSMTGAPKKRVMELIEKYERCKRGIFSGSIGYIRPDGDFDFNVVIRSIMYNASDQVVSYQVGSAITGYSDPSSEWEECLLKAEAIKKVLAMNDQDLLHI